MAPCFPPASCSHIRSQRGYGKIVQLSGGGATGPLPGLSAYAASKAAVVRFAETLAEELREQRVDVNAIAPGPLNTRMLDEVLRAGPECVGEAFYEKALEQQRSGGIPLREGAKLAVFLGSLASDGITGKLLSAVWDPWSELPSTSTISPQTSTRCEGSCPATEGSTGGRAEMSEQGPAPVCILRADGALVWERARARCPSRCSKWPESRS